MIEGSNLSTQVMRGGYCHRLTPTVLTFLRFHTPLKTSAHHLPVKWEVRDFYIHYMEEYPIASHRLKEKSGLQRCFSVIYI